MVASVCKNVGTSFCSKQSVVTSPFYPFTKAKYYMYAKNNNFHFFRFYSLSVYRSKPSVPELVNLNSLNTLKAKEQLKIQSKALIEKDMLFVVSRLNQDVNLQVSPFYIIEIKMKETSEESVPITVYYQALLSPLDFIKTQM